MTRSEFDDIRAFLADKTTHLGDLLGIARTLIDDLEHARLREASLRNDYLRLLTAARATVAADIAGEPDPLAFIRHELAERGQLPEDDEAVQHILADARAAAALRAYLESRPDESEAHGGQVHEGQPDEGQTHEGPDHEGRPWPSQPVTGVPGEEAPREGHAGAGPASQGPAPYEYEPPNTGAPLPDGPLIDPTFTGPTITGPTFVGPTFTGPTFTGQDLPDPHVHSTPSLGPSSPDPLPQTEAPANRALSRPRGPRMRSCVGTGRHLRR